MALDNVSEKEAFRATDLMNNNLDGIKLHLDFFFETIKENRKKSA
jgi:hypothetical protein